VAFEKGETTWQLGLCGIEERGGGGPAARCTWLQAQGAAAEGGVKQVRCRGSDEGRERRVRGPAAIGPSLI
jgi:hypothetical protein